MTTTPLSTVLFLFLGQVRLAHHHHLRRGRRLDIHAGPPARQHAIASANIGEGDVGRLAQGLFAGRQPFVLSLVAEIERGNHAAIVSDDDLFSACVDGFNLADQTGNRRRCLRRRTRRLSLRDQSKTQRR